MLRRPRFEGLGLLGVAAQHNQPAPGASQTVGGSFNVTEH